MKKTLAILATGATVGATTISAPAQARRDLPRLGSVLRRCNRGWRRGATAPIITGRATAYYGPRYYLGIRAAALRAVPTPITADRIIAIATAPLVRKKSPEHRSGLFAHWNEA